MSESARTRSDVGKDNGIYCNSSLTLNLGSVSNVFFFWFSLPEFPKIARLPVVSVWRPPRSTQQLSSQHGSLSIISVEPLSFSRTCRNQLLYYPKVETRRDLFNCTNSMGISPTHSRINVVVLDLKIFTDHFLTFF